MEREAGHWFSQRGQRRPLRLSETVTFELWPQWWKWVHCSGSGARLVECRGLQLGVWASVGSQKMGQWRTPVTRLTAEPNMKMFFFSQASRLHTKVPSNQGHSISRGPLCQSFISVPCRLFLRWNAGTVPLLSSVWIMTFLPFPFSSPSPDSEDWWGTNCLTAFSAEHLLQD